MQNSQNRRPFFIILGTVAILVVGGLIYFQGKSTTPVNSTQVPKQETSNLQMAQEKSETITLTQDGFKPNSLAVKSGTRVIWLNKSGKTGTVNSEPHPAHTLYPVLQLGSFEDGSSVQTVFDKTGTYTYHNHLNPSQKGTVIVE